MVSVTATKAAVQHIPLTCVQPPQSVLADLLNGVVEWNACKL